LGEGSVHVSLGKEYAASISRENG